MVSGNLSYQWKKANISIKLIVINAAIFLFARLGSWIIGTQPSTLMNWFVLPAALESLILQVWGLLTYSFLHFDFFHIFWNMLILYWFGQIILNLFTEKRFLTIYLVGALCGGILFVFSYNVIPVLEGKLAYLIGASAGVRAIMIFIAAYTPNTEVRLVFINVKLWQIGMFVVLSDLIQLSNQSPDTGNAGGLIAHMGGALFGYFYASQLKKGNDIGSWFEKFMDSIVNLFKSRKKSPLKTVHKAKKTAQTKTTNRKTTSSKVKNTDQVAIDAILDKISKSGYESLTKQEKDFLFKAGKD